MPLALPALIRGAQLVQLIESPQFLLDPKGIDLSGLGFGTPSILYWNDLSGARVPCAVITVDSETGKMTVACRGTASIWEWLDDAMFALRQANFLPAGCLVEDGFGRVYESTTLEKGGDFRPLLGDPAKVTAYGHSLGAAWVGYFAGHMGIEAAYPIAMPKIGNELTAAFIEARTGQILRPTNSHDVVPLLPCNFLNIAKYVNPGPELALNSAGLVAHGPGCAHHLTTYLYLLGGLCGQAFPLGGDCLP